MHLMSKCPHCDVNIVLEDFFEVEVKETRKGKIKKRISGFKGEFIHIGYKNEVKMWSCPSCDKIIGFSEYKWDAKT